MEEKFFILFQLRRELGEGQGAREGRRGGRKSGRVFFLLESCAM
jgi:hypothetical protein